MFSMRHTVGQVQRRVVSGTHATTQQQATTQQAIMRRTRNSMCTRMRTFCFSCI